MDQVDLVAVMIPAAMAQACKKSDLAHRLRALRPAAADRRGSYRLSMVHFTAASQASELSTEMRMRRGAAMLPGGKGVSESKCPSSERATLQVAHGFARSAVAIDGVSCQQGLATKGSRRALSRSIACFRSRGHWPLRRRNRSITLLLESLSDRRKGSCKP